jgi:hypothetical protein
MHDPRESHLAFLKCILRYVKGTLSYGLRIGTGPVDSLLLQPILMLIGLAALIPVVLPLVIVSFSATLWFLGRRNIRLQSPALVQRPNIALLLMRLLSVVGFVNFFRSFMFHSQRLRSSSVTMSSAVYMAVNPVHHR